MTRIRNRLERELGLQPAVLPAISSTEDVLLRIRKAVRERPPKLVRAFYQAVDATSPTWRLLECYSLRYRGQDNRPLLFAACEKENWKIEAFRLDRFHDVQPTNIPFSPRWPIEL